MTARTDTLHVPDASIHYAVRGEGQLLLLIQGGDGDADGMAGLAAHFVDNFTVVTRSAREFAVHLREVLLGA